MPSADDIGVSSICKRHALLRLQGNVVQACHYLKCTLESIPRAVKESNAHLCPERDEPTVYSHSLVVLRTHLLNAMRGMGMPYLALSVRAHC